MKDVFILPRGLGLWGVGVLRFVTFYIMYNTSVLRICQPPLFKFSKSYRSNLEWNDQRRKIQI